MSEQFNDRASYTLWKLNWKAEYKEISDVLRNLKTLIKDLSRETSYKHQPPVYRDYEELSNTQWKRYCTKATATKMLEDYHLGKIEAQQQYLIAKGKSNE